MHTSSWSNTCGPLNSTPFFPSASRPGDLGSWSGFNYVHVLSIPTLNCSRQRWDAFIVVFTLLDTFLSLWDPEEKIVSGGIVTPDILPRQMPAGWGQRASLASDSPLGEEGGLDPCKLHYPLIWFPDSRVAGFEVVRRYRIVIKSTSFGSTSRFKSWFCLLLAVPSWTSCSYFLALSCLVCEIGTAYPCLDRVDGKSAWENAHQSVIL